MKAGDEFTAVYVIHGMSLGRTNIVVTAVQHGKKNLVTSDAREIQVCSSILCFPTCYLILKLIIPTVLSHTVAFIYSGVSKTYLMRYFLALF